MEWQIRTLARTSDVSGKAFATGDPVTSIICKVEGESEIRRVDLLTSEVEGFELPGPPLGRWTRRIKEPESGAENASAPDLQSAEEFFVSLFGATSGEEASRTEKDALKHMLALALERRRVLKRTGGVMKDGTQTYRFPKRDEAFAVPVVDVAPSLLVTLRETLGDILL